ncbi:MAG: SMI1/KNR4 family protein [Daejeonella sp.]
MIEKRLQTIQIKLQQLISLDKKHTIFGVNGHKYKFNPPIPLAELDEFEKKHQITLPEEYKLYLSTIANGGTGPYYGLYSMEKGIEEAEIYSTLENESIKNPFTSDFPYSNQQTKNFIDYYYSCLEDGEDDEIEYLDIPDEFTGAIFLSEYGCGWSYLLVIKGGQAGKVWYHGENLSPCFDTNKQWTFLDWYEEWLDTSLENFNTKPQQKEFDKSIRIYNRDGWKLKEIPKEVFECRGLRKLDFSRNDLSEFPKQITQLSELRVLKLSMTPIVEIPGEISELQNLKKLELNYNNHLDLPNSLADLNNLEVLSMHHNYKLDEIPEVVGQIPNLKKLILSYCGGLKRIPGNVENLSVLEILHLNECPLLTSLPENIGSLTSLKYLYLGGTRIKSLPQSFENLQNLEALGIDIEELDLADVIEKIKNLAKLEFLKITNQLDFPESFKELKSVKKLVITQNYTLWHQGYKALPLPENLCLMPNLEELDLSGNNQAISLPEGLGKLNNLKKIRISATGIKTFPDSMQLLSDLIQVEGELDKESNSAFGVLPEEKKKLIKWFPKAKIWI